MFMIGSNIGWWVIKWTKSSWRECLIEKTNKLKQTRNEKKNCTTKKNHWKAFLLSFQQQQFRSHTCMTIENTKDTKLVILIETILGWIDRNVQFVTMSIFLFRSVALHTAACIVNVVIEATVSLLDWYSVLQTHDLCLSNLWLFLCGRISVVGCSNCGETIFRHVGRETWSLRWNDIGCTTDDMTKRDGLNIEVQKRTIRTSNFTER